jgi:hypothetical protein
VNIEDLPLSLKNLDQLLAHVPVDRQRLLATEFVEVDAEAPVFNEWNNAVDNLLMVDRDSHDKNDGNEEDDEMPSETPPKLIEAMEMVRRLHLLAAPQQPQLNSQVTQLYIDAKGLKQMKIKEYFK